MDKTMLFVIHGMGIHAADWADAVRAKLDETAARYPGLQGQSLWDRVELIPLRYDDRLAEVLAQWQAAAGPVSAFAEANKLAGSGSLAWLDGVAAEAAGFFWSHLADVVIYRFLKMYRDSIRAAVADQIIGPLMELPVAARDFNRVVFVAHSLGTAVLHDALHLLGTGRFAGHASIFAAPNARFRALFTLANTSRLLQTDIKAYESIVQPGPQNKLHSNCSLFYNYAHELDPVCAVWRFAPEHFSPRHYHHDVLRHYRDWNIHDFSHYLDNPRVHVHLINQLLGGRAISKKEFIAAVDQAAYPQFAGRFQDVPALQAKLRELQAIYGALREDSDLGDLLKAVAKTSLILGDIRDLIAGFGL